MIRELVFVVPWGVREALLDACIERVGTEAVCARLLPKLKITEIGAVGDRGVVTSVSNDMFVLTEYASAGTFAQTVTQALTSFFADGSGTYMDVGANIGLTTIPLARNPNVRCLAFEPEPRNFDLLRRNVARNAPDSVVHFHQIALFHSRSSLSLAVAESNIGDHRLTLSKPADRRTVEIAALPLDDFIDQVTGRLAIKVDTQGAEPHVVAGGQKAFARAGLVAMEFCPFLMRELGGDPNLVIDLMSGFDRVAIMKGGHAEAPVFTTPATAQQALRDKLRTAAASDGDYLDILAVRDTPP